MAEKHYYDGPAGLSNKFKYYIEFFHIPSGESVKFDAFLTNLDDSFESDWNSEEVYGRMDPIQTYKGTKRSIALEWELVAASVAEAEANLSKCTTLFGMLYPVYSPHSAGGENMVVSSPPLFKVSVVNLVRDAASSVGSGGVGTAASSGLVCTIDGFNYSPDIDAGFMHVEAGTVYPQTIKLGCGMTVMHTHGLGYTGDGRRQANFPYGAQPSMAPSRSETGTTTGSPSAVSEAAGKKITGG